MPISSNEREARELRYFAGGMIVLAFHSLAAATGGRWRAATRAATDRVLLTGLAWGRNDAELLH
jgi:hypothetical protein